MMSVSRINCRRVRTVSASLCGACDRPWQQVSANVNEFLLVSLSFCGYRRKRVRAKTSLGEGAADCKSAGLRLVGSSPTSPTIAEKQRSVIREASEQIADVR